MDDASVIHEGRLASKGEAPSGRLMSWWRRGLHDGVLLAVWLVALYGLWVVLSQVIPLGALGFDSHAYWVAATSEHPYLAAPGERDAYLYSPFFLQVISPISWLPWSGFVASWVLLEGACFVWLTRSMPWRWRIPVLMLCALEVVLGNVIGVLGVMMVLGLRRPGLWAFAFLTKITPGGVGAIWFAARGEWAALARLSGWTMCLAAVSYAVSPELWQQWLQFLATTSDGEGMLMRAARMSVAVIVVAMGARRGAAWTMPIGMLLMLPHFGLTVKDLALLAAVPALLQATRAGPYRS